MITTLQLKLRPEIAAKAESLNFTIAQQLQIDRRTIRDVRIRKRSIDARQRQIFVNLTVEVFVGEVPPAESFQPADYPDVSGAPQVIVVGAGPGGLFAALRLIELGAKPIVLERGKDVKARRKDIALIPHEQTIDPESNYSFGEGGAGAFSDGKLYTRSKKRGNVEKILQVFCAHGADASILYDAHPHIGTDRLPVVIERMRQSILSAGGEVHFETRVDGLLLENGAAVGVTTSQGGVFEGPVILATGHSARDVYHWLHQAGIHIESKGLAVGVRLEHPSQLIDSIQYHNKEGRGKYLPAAEYSYVSQVKNRGVYSFCMCPGGFVVPAATGPEQVVVNGMSPANRGSKWSNSGMVSELRPEDLVEESLARFMSESMADERFAAEHADYEQADNPLRLMYFQEALERMSWLQGGRSQVAPAQRMADFTNGRLSFDLPKSSYSPGLISSPVHFWMPRFVTERLAEGFRVFGRKSHGFLTNEAVIIGVESRTSSPVRITRDKDSLCHVQIANLYPCGEGAGYAGGIISAAIDGERCAEALMAQAF